MSILAKVIVLGVVPMQGIEGEQVHMRPVCSSDPNSENYSFSKWTPSGDFKLTVTNPNAFGFWKENKEYLVTFTPDGEPVSGIQVVSSLSNYESIQAVIDNIQGPEKRCNSREDSLAVTKLQEALHWLNHNKGQ